MNKKSILDKINTLRKELSDHNYKYYILDQPIISDKYFDLKMRELSILENLNPEFKDINSPTQKIGGQVTKTFPTFFHEYPMYSLENIYDLQELIKWEKRILKKLKNISCYVCELKYDGISISIFYKKGIFYRAVTRGDGYYGDEVTSNIRTIRSIPLKLKGKFPDELEVRGEVILPLKGFKKINKIRLEKGKNLYSNPRNTASGSIKLQNSSEVAKRPLDCLIYEIKSKNFLYSTHYKSLKKAREWGFKVPLEIKICKNIVEILNFINNWKKKRYQLPYETDGIVIKVNSYEQQILLGYTSKFPRWAIAYKFQSQRISTKILNVTFQVGRTGIVTPVAKLKPVKLGGTIIKRASLYNEDIIFNFDIHYGDYVYIEKGGEVIPKIVSVIKHKRNKENKLIKYPKKCPYCNTNLVRKKKEVGYYCVNENLCPPQVIGKIKHFVSRKAMNIKNLGIETIQLFYKSGLLKNVSDLYQLNYYQIISLKGIAKKSAKNILNNINQSKNKSFEKVLYALGIRYIGENLAYNLAYHFLNIDSIKNANYKDIVSIKNVGKNIADSLYIFFSKIENIQMINKLKKSGLNFKIKNYKLSKEIKFLNQKTFLFTGKLIHFTRDKVKEIVLSKGGIILNTVNKKLDYLIVGEKAGSNFEKAQLFKNIKILNEIEFLKLLKINTFLQK